METVVIDIEAQYRDKTEAGVEKSADDMERLRKKMEATEDAGKKANASLEKIASTAAQIAKKTISIPVKIIDYATRPLRSLIGYATSLRGILTGIVMGQTAQKLFVTPTQYAETLKGHSLAFENLLGSAEAASKMIQEIQAFDEKSPFNTMQIIEQSRMLMTYKLATQENVLSMIETIGDASMGVGAGDAGIERIVRALGQMKAKGKVSAEEMLQLSEVNISGWQYLADAMGVSTAEVQEMTSKNKIPVETAINALLSGMKKDFGGMANENAAKTLSGVWGQISSVLENGPMLKWGQGLSEGAMEAATAASGWLEESKDAVNDLGDALYELGKGASTYASDKIIQFGERVKGVLNSDAFRNADGMGEKLKIAWDQVIAEPFTAWWESDGQEFLGDVAGKIGTGLGKFYNGAITTLLGIDAEGAAEGGVNIGARFAEGFLEGFNAKKVWEAIKESFKNALKIVPGGEEATTGSWVSAALLGYGGMKVAGAAAPLIKGAGGLGKAAVGAAGGSIGAAELAITLGAGNLAGGASLSAGALSALGLGAAAGGVTGGLGLISGLADLTRALNESSTEKEKSVSGWSAGSKFGLVGAGAAAGAGIGSIVPVVGTAAGALIGAGLGGLGALLGGGTLGEFFSDLADGTGQIKAARKAIEETGTALQEASRKASDFAALRDRYEDLNRKVHSGKLGAADLEQAQSDLAETIRGLADLYPDLISQYDVENGKLGEKLDLIREITEEERKQARRESQMAVYEGEKALPGLEKQIRGSKEEQESALAEYDALIDKAQRLRDIESQYRTAGRLGNLKGEDSAEYKAAFAKAQAALDAYNRESGDNYYPAALGNGYEKAMKEAGKLLEKAQGAGAELEGLMASYQEIYQGFLEHALNPESLDAAGGLDAILSKIQEIEEIQAQRAELEKKIAGLDKGSKEYDETAKKIEEAKGRQRELTDAVEPFRDALLEVLKAVEDINSQFDLLGGKRLDFGAMGLSGAASFTGYSGKGKSALPSYSDLTRQNFKDPFNMQKTLGFASGTLSAPEGWAWVGEDGPELVKMRGGERVYNAEASHRIAEETARSGRENAGRAGSFQVSLGGMTVNITSSGEGGDAVEQLRRRLPEIGNELCAMIATELSRSYANMPEHVEGI